MNHPAQTYRQFSVQGATPLGLVVMLYDRAIADLRRAIAAIEAHDIEQRTKHLNHFFSVIAELESSLNHEREGSVAKNLAMFYKYARAQAINAAVKNSKEILSHLYEHFSTLRDAWREGERLLATQGTSSPADARSARKDSSDAGTIELSVFD